MHPLRLLRRVGLCEPTHMQVQTGKATVLQRHTTPHFLGGSAPPSVLRFFFLCSFTFAHTLLSHHPFGAAAEGNPVQRRPARGVSLRYVQRQGTELCIGEVVSADPNTPDVQLDHTALQWWLCQEHFIVHRRVRSAHLGCLVRSHKDVPRVPGCSTTTEGPSLSISLSVSFAVCFSLSVTPLRVPLGVISHQALTQAAIRLRYCLCDLGYAPLPKL
jgi:hypothetical protein